MALKIGITGVNAMDSPGPGVAVTRSIREKYGKKVTFVGLGYDAIDPGLYDSQLFASGYLLPYPANGKRALLERLKVIQAAEKLDIILPTLDSEMQHFSELQPELQQMGIASFLPTPEQIRVRAKPNLPALAERHGFFTPRTISVPEPSGLMAATQQIGFPLLLKGIFYEAYLCRDFSQVETFARLVSTRWGYPVLLQEFLEGEELNAAAIGDGKGRMLSALCMKKILLTDKGKGWAGVSIKNERLLELCRQFISHTQWKGALEMETLLARRDQKLYIIEINPRFPAWIYLSVAAQNNLPALWVELARNGRLPKKTLDYQTGKVFTHYTIDLIGEISQLEALLTRGEIHYS